MDIVNPQSSTVIFGFDSAWTDAPKAPGAICTIAFGDRGQVEFHEPRLVSFADALAFIEELRQDFVASLVALDQPTVVPNAAGSRPVDKVAAALVSFVGGGVQTANRSKTACSVTTHRSGLFSPNSKQRRPPSRHALHVPAIF